MNSIRHWFKSLIREALRDEAVAREMRDIRCEQALFAARQAAIAESQERAIAKWLGETINRNLGASRGTRWRQ